MVRSREPDAAHRVVRTGAIPGVRSLRPETVLGLQRTLGNHAVQRMLARERPASLRAPGARVQRVVSDEAKQQIGQLSREQLLARLRQPEASEEPGEIATAWLAARGTQDDMAAWAALLGDAGLLNDPPQEEHADPGAEQEDRSPQRQRERMAAGALESAQVFVAFAESCLEEALDADDTQHFIRVFGAEADLAALHANLRRMGTYLASADLQIAYVQGEQTSINAFTLQGAITLRTPFFDRLDDRARRNTVVHESVHAALNVPDYAYTTERLIDLLSPQASLRNPDSYVWFLSALLEREPDPKGQIQDTFPEGMQDARRTEVRKAIGLMAASFTKVENLFAQTWPEAADAVQKGRPVANNTRYCMQEVKKVFTGPSQQWDHDRPTEAVVKGLKMIAQVVQYLLGGLVAPVTIRDADQGAELAWARAGQDAASLSLPAELPGAELYATLLTAYVRDLLAPTRQDKWKSYHDLVVTVAPGFIRMGDYRGVAMAHPGAVQ